MRKPPFPLPFLADGVSAAQMREAGMKKDDWVKLTYQFTQNIPSNLLEESQIAGNLAGIVSQQTQLSILSCVDNVQQEIEQIKQDEEEGITDGFPTNRTVEVEDVVLDETTGTTEANG